MSRNGSGAFAVINTFTPNTVMSATAVNQNFTDAGSEITNSLARDGQSIMTGQFKAADGTVGAPGISFGSDTNTGFRRASSDEMRWVAGSADVMYIDSVGKAWFLGALNVAGALNLGGGITGSAVADLVAIEALSGVGGLRRTGTNTWALDDGTTMVTFIKDGNTTVLASGVIGDIQIPFVCTITGVTLLADASGSIVVDIWKDSYANFPPTVADSVTASAKPTISAATKATDTTLTGWTTSVAAGDVLRFKIDSCSTITRIGIYLKVKRFI